MIDRSIHPVAGNAAVMPGLTVARYWRGVPERVVDYCGGIVRCRCGYLRNQSLVLVLVLVLVLGPSPLEGSTATGPRTSTRTRTRRMPFSPPEKQARGTTTRFLLSLEVQLLEVPGETVRGGE
jgi:hypothetical protein